MKVSILMTVCSLFLTLPSQTKAQDFSFDVDAKFVNISFESIKDLEDILGVSRSVSGSATLKGKSATFDIRVPVASLRTGIDLRDEHMRSEHWLDAARYPHIRFYGDSIKELGPGKYEVKGNFSMHGVDKPLTVVVDVVAISPEQAKAAGMEAKKWVKVRASFVVRLSDHGIKVPDMALAKVSDEWRINVSIFGKEK